MIDREKVIKALEFCTDPRIVNTCYGECPYAVADDEYKCDEMKRDALELLKEQEAVSPRRIDGKRNHFIKCGNCNYDLVTGFQFCPHCGRAVKWE